MKHWAIDLRRRAQESGPPTEGGIGPKNCACEVEFNEIRQPIEDALRSQVFRPHRITPAAARRRFAFRMPLAEIIVGYPLNLRRIKAKLVECLEIRFL